MRTIISHSFVLSILIFSTHSLSQQSEGPKFPSGLNSNTWADPVNAYFDEDSECGPNDVYTTGEPADTGYWVNFGFSSIPASATILGIVVTLEVNAGDDGDSLEVQLMDAGQNPVGQFKGIRVDSGSCGIVSLGSSTDAWSTGGSPDMIGVNFGVVLREKDQPATGGVTVGYISITIYFLGNNGVLEGVAFEDVNENGQKDSEDPGVGGVTIRLGGDTVDSAVTASDGLYSFLGLPAGNYTVSEDDNPSCEITHPSNGAYNITLADGAVHDTLNFGSSCSCDSNVVQNASFEDGGSTSLPMNVPGWTGQGWSVSTIPFSGISGAYDNPSDGVNPTDYLRQYFATDVFMKCFTYRAWSLVSGTVFRTYVYYQDSSIDSSDYSHSGDGNHALVTPSFDSDKRAYAIEFRIVVGSSNSIDLVSVSGDLPGSILGTKWEDTNGNGIRDTLEGGLSGWSFMAISASNDTSIATAFFQGVFTFSNLQPGTYSVREISQESWVQSGGESIQSVIVSSNETDSVYFGNFRLGSISGMKYNDIDSNGVNNSPDSGLAGWKIYISSAGFADSMSTDSSGNYSFTSLGPGTYTISEEARPGWTRTVPAENYTVTLLSGLDTTGLNFGNEFSPAIVLTSPDGGEAWMVGSTHPITWTSAGVVNVTLEYSTDNGATWNTIATAVAAESESYNWQLPNSLTSQALIRISDASNASLNDQSNAVFSIVPVPSITLTSPNGGESWEAGSSQQITWSSVGIENVKIEYSTDTGDSWNTVVPSVEAGGGEYEWTVPNTITSQALVRVSDATDAATNDLSDASFSIAEPPPPSITLTSPNGGEKWKIGSTHQITWTSNGIENVMIEYSTDNGSTWTTITTSVAAAGGTYSWLIPNIESDQALVRVSDASDNTPVDQSDALFTFAKPWNAQSGCTDKHLQDVSFVSLTEGWVVGNNGIVCHTTNGGQDWQSQNSGVNNHLNGVSFINVNLGWAVGDGGIVLHTTDGGSNWSEQATLPVPQLNDVVFVNSLKGWTVGNNGTIYATTDGGSNYAQQANGLTGNHLIGVTFLPNSTKGWAVGEGATILATTNGVDWSMQSSPNENHLNDASFVNAMTGWIVGNNGTILATADGGGNWSEQSSGTTKHLNGVSFISTTLGWAVGNNGTILRYDLALSQSRTSSRHGAGVSGWTQIESGTTDDLSMVVFLGSASGWVVGDSGAVLEFVPAEEDSGQIAVSVSAMEQWNLVSVPLHAGNYSAESLFPSAISDAYSYVPGEGYMINEHLQNRAGYWVKFADEQFVNLVGTPVEEDAIDVVEGWNLVGSISYPVSSSAIVSDPAGIVNSFFFGYSQGYTAASSVEPGKGYWVKVSQDGRLYLMRESEFGLKNIPTDVRLFGDREFHSLSIEDKCGNRQELFFGRSSEPIENELPPAPPSDIFDVRFSSGHFVKLFAEESWTGQVRITSGCYPMKIHVRRAVGSNDRIDISDPHGRLLNGGTDVVLKDPEITKFEVTVGMGNQIPETFSLEQNYPNPFNPTTGIEYALPTREYVRLTVYDVLGKEIAVLVDGMKEPGVHSVQLDMEGFPSGVYYYRIGAGSNTATRKMILIQ